MVYFALYICQVTLISACWNQTNHDDDKKKNADVWYVADLKDRHHTRQREIHEDFQTLASDWGFDAHRRDVRVDDDVDVDDDDFRVGDDVEVDDIRVDDDDDNDDSDDKPDAEIMIVRPGSWRRWHSREFSNPRIGRFCLGSHCRVVMDINLKLKTMTMIKTMTMLMMMVMKKKET